MAILQNIGAVAAIVFNLIILILVAINLKKSIAWGKKQKEYYELISAPHLLEDLKALKEVINLTEEKYNIVLKERDQQRKLVSDLQNEIERLTSIHEDGQDPGITTTLEAWDITAAKEIAGDLQKSMQGDYIFEALKPLQEFTYKFSQSLDHWNSIDQNSKEWIQMKKALREAFTNKKPTSPMGG